LILYDEIKRCSKEGTMRAIRFAVLALLAIAAPAAVPASAQTPSSNVWQWSAPAMHHQAVCLVTADSGNSRSSGSGCYVRIGDVHGVLTARHCLDGRITIRWADGSTTAGEPTTDKTGADLGFIAATHAMIAPLEISSAEPTPGQWLEFAGFGGPDNKLRHWWGRLQAGGGRDEGGNSFADYDCAVMQGDSGGPILNQWHQVVGVITCGAGNPIASLGSAQTFATTGGPAYPTVREFVTRVNQRYGGLFIGGVRGSCGPSGCGPQPGGGSGNWAYPPQAGPVPAPPQPQQPPPPLIPIPAPSPAPVPAPTPTPAPSGPEPQFSVNVDYDRLARVLLEYCAADGRFRGPKGDQGDQGNPGPPAMLTAEDTQRIIASLYAAMLADGRFRGPPGEISAAEVEALYQRLRTDPALRGQPGPPGPAGSAAAPAPVDIDAIAAAVAPKLPPIYFRKVNAGTGVEISPPEPVRLGEGFTFLLTPANGGR
jgi:hypothetical protein